VAVLNEWLQLYGVTPKAHVLCLYARPMPTALVKFLLGCSHFGRQRNVSVAFDAHPAVV
jgi:hypothetical protein